MSTRNGSRVAGPIPPHIKKTASGRPAFRPNKYTDLKPSEQRGTSGQRRVVRQAEKAERERLAAEEAERLDAEALAEIENV